METIDIRGRLVGPGRPVYLVAEIGSNHGHDPAVVRSLIDHAAAAGFDAVKFQTYEPLEVFSGAITTRDVHYEEMYGFRPWVEVARDHILMPRDWFPEAFAHARGLGLEAFCTAHSAADLDFVERFDPPWLKVASLDVSYTDLLAEIGRRRRPVLLATGMHRLDEIETAVRTIRAAGEERIVLLHCVSNYPPAPETVNLRNIPMLAQAFDLPAGLSDHSLENYAALASVALGACVIEKHVTLDRSSPGPDHAFAQDPAGMRDLVGGVRQVEKALGSFRRELSPDEEQARKMARRSVVARRAISPGEILDRDNLKITRPGNGIHPAHLECLLGRRARVGIAAESLIRWDMVE
jgi:N,N'-diacetyllegionaminate synthase